MFTHLRHTVYRLLRKSERYTKTDMLYVAKGGGWLVFGQGISMIVAFGLALAFANLLTPTEYGVYRFILSGIGIVTAFSLTGMHSALIQSMSKGYRGAFMQAFRTHLTWNILPGVISFGVALYYLSQNNTTLFISFLLVALFLPIYISTSIYDQALISAQQFQKRTLLNIAHQLFHGLSLIATLFLTDNVIVIITVYLATISISNVIFFIHIRKAFSAQNNEPDPTLPSYAKQLTGLGLLSRIAREIDRILVFHFLGAASLAIYSFAWAIPGRVDGIKVSLNNLVLPKISTHSFESLQSTLPRKLIIATVIASLGAIVYIFIAPFLFQWFFPQYIESIFFSQLLALSLILSPATALMYQVLLAHKQKRGIMIADVVSPIIKIALIPILIPWLGIIGAVWAFLIERVVRFVLLIGILFLKK